MWISLIVLSSACSVGQSTFTKLASAKDPSSSSMRFNSLKIGAALILFLLISFYSMQFHLPTVLFASWYGLTLFFSTWFGYLALMNGSMALTSLIVSYSVIIPCFFGIAFLGETPGVMRIAGIILLLISMYLLKQQADNVKYSKQWFLYVAITFLCNGFGSITQKMHQTLYPSSYCNEFMICSLFVTFVLFFIISMNSREEKIVGVRKYAVIAGILMGFSNYLSLFLSSKVNASVLFPLSSTFSMFCNIAISKLCFKDKFNAMQLTGIGLGVFSVLLIK